MHTDIPGYRIDQFTGMDDTMMSNPGTCHFIQALLAGASIVSGLVGASAAKSAAKSQVASADAATALQRDIFTQNRADFAPFLQVGTGAINELGRIFLGQDFGATSGQSSQISSIDAQIKAKNDELAALTTRGPISSAQETRRGERGGQPRPGQASDTARQAALRSDIARLEGQAAQLRNAPPGAPLSTSDRLSSFFESPDYQFRLGEGEKGINRALAARGQSNSGRVLKGLTEFNGNLASGEFNTFVNRLTDLAGIGSNTAAQGAQSANQSGGQIGQSLLDAGTARASGIVGSSNALSQGFGDAARGFGNAFSGQNQLQNFARTDVNNPALANIF